MMLSKCSSSFAYWDIHNQKFKGRWSTYLSTVVYKGEQENREPDSFFHQTLRIGFNNWGKHFQYDLETEEIGIATYEGYRLNAFLEMYQLQAIFLYNDEVWGTLDEETGKWNGVIGMVGYGGADIGVCSISYTFERSLLVDCTTICLLTWLDGWTTKAVLRTEKVWGYKFNIPTGGLAIFARMCVSVCPAVAFTATME
ncbi:glutamate receptor 3, partial [Eurytemora carolleeae]|uniref:glutamate receptor 3 n=1 Tax=Eurytemora carolleeae TaxID=1294199 RepID=UPI000C75CB25